jgi:anti-sigma B factor antagonist
VSLQVALNHKSDGLWEVALAGSLDTETAPQLEEDLAPVFGSDSRKLLFNMTDLDYVSSAGIRVIAMASKMMKRRAGAIAMTGLQPHIAKVFEIVKALPNLSIFKDQAEADEYLDFMQKKVLKGQ